MDLADFHERFSGFGPDGCWPWLRTRNYGYLSWIYNGRRIFVGTHVLALVLSTGEDIAGRLACHTCDNPPCCNPAHLYWGTSSRNQLDKFARGRGNLPDVSGANSYRAKMTEADVLEARARYTAGETQTALAREYGVCQATLSKAIRGMTWSRIY